MKLRQLLFFFMAPLFAYSQSKELNLPLIFHDGNGPFEYESFPIKWNDTSLAFKNTYPEIKGIPENLKNIKRGIICFDLIQYVYQNHLTGKISDERFAEIKNISAKNFDDRDLVKSEIKCFVSLVNAVNENNETVCLIDTNNNYDFSDEIPFKPLEESLPANELNKQLKKVVCQRVLNGKIINEKIPLLIVKSGSYFLYSIAQYATVILNVKKKNYKLEVCPLYFHSRRWTLTQLVASSKSLSAGNAVTDAIVSDGGFIAIGDNIYKYKGVDISKNLLHLQKVSGNNQYSSQVGFRAPIFKSIELLTGNEISLASYRRKHVLLDFWGTWCMPCREQLPELAAINNAIDTSKFVLISVASSDKLDNLKNFIAKENMLWPQIFSDKITGQYRVNQFPSSFLIDPHGIIIAKDLPIDLLKRKLSEMALLKED